jgi:type VI protein secretion system component VasF
MPQPRQIYASTQHLRARRRRRRSRTPSRIGAVAALTAAVLVAAEAIRSLA